MNNKPGRGINRKGRAKRQGKFVALGDGLLTSDAWCSLSGGAVRYYIELRRRYNGLNNGELHLSLREAIQTLGMGQATAWRAQKELVEKGLIQRVEDGNFQTRLATTWRLTDEPAGKKLPTNDYKKWKAKPNVKQSENAPRDLFGKQHVDSETKPD